MICHNLNSILKINMTKKFIQYSTDVLWNKPEIGFETGIKIYNCAAKTKVPLVVSNEKVATWYTCGPTVYDSTHIGHASCYVKLDIIQRILRNHFNIEIITAMNVTDIDDKIIKKAELTHVKDIKDISKRYEIEFWKDLKRLNVKEPDIKMKVTENIQVIIEFIETLLKNDQAYIASDNSVYFHINKYKRYGKLTPVILNESKTQHLNKSAISDFALWKAQKNLNEPNWPVPWSSANGRPGWHIECSALATKVFGKRIDFHAGGLDLKFPHHENEEAQSCCYHNTEQWVNYWIHTGPLHLTGQDAKMSKSLKNTISVSELLKRHSPDDFRMACILSNYRNSMEYSDELMHLAKSTLNRFTSFLSDCEAYLQGKKDIRTTTSINIGEILKETKNGIDLAFKDDFDTSKSISHLIEFTNNISRVLNSNEEINSTSLIAEIASAKIFVQKTLNSMGFDRNIVSTNTNNTEKDIDLHEVFDKIIEIRHSIREIAIQTKNENLFNICDEIRQMFKNKNIEIKDHSKGSSWKSK